MGRFRKTYGFWKNFHYFLTICGVEERQFLQFLLLGEYVVDFKIFMLKPKLGWQQNDSTFDMNLELVSFMYVTTYRTHRQSFFIDL